MLFTFLLIILLGNPLSQAFYIEDGYQEILYNPISDLTYLYLTPDDDKSSENDIKETYTRRIKSKDEDYLFNTSLGDYDLHEYNKLTKIILNVTRRDLNPQSFEYGAAAYNWHWFTYQDKNRGTHKEWAKKKKIMDLSLHFLVHTRYKVYQALKQRDSVRGDKRYKLGYLFNRLRRLHTEHNLMYGAAKVQKEKAPSLKALLRFYQHVVRIAVDIRDTQALIKEVFNKEDPVDFIKISANKTTKKESNIPTPEGGLQ